MIIFAKIIVTYYIYTLYARNVFLMGFSFYFSFKTVTKQQVGCKMYYVVLCSRLVVVFYFPRLFHNL